MRRGARGKWKRSHQNLDERPPGLVGREIGLFYKNRQKLKKSEYGYQIKLDVPESVVSALHENIKSIEDIAQKENIYLEQVKTLKFAKSKISTNADYIPIETEHSEIQSLHVTNIYPRDDDVIFVSKDEPDNKNETASNSNNDVIYVNTKVHEAPSLELDSKTKLLNAIEAKHEVIKKARADLTPASNISVKSSKSERYPIYKVEELKKSNLNKVLILDTDRDTKPNPTKIEHAIASDSSSNVIILNDDEDENPIKSEKTPLETKYTVSNNAPSTSRQNIKSSKSKDFKYGYDDIITGTFEEKLDQSLAKGISINIKNNTINELNEALLEEYNAMIEEKPKYKEMKAFRSILPAYQKSKELLEVINKNQIVVISGETGCGKSTQVPQIILDDAIKNKRGANVKILVTEPRRIAASSLAMRVADERAESMGKSVGYSVRLERVECRPRGSIMFCTTGVLLVELEVDQCLSNYSHIILDEVHERDCQIDISMCMLKQVLKKRKDLKLILMSATIDAESLCAYYDNCPMLHIEGLAYPVEDVYLEDVLKMTGYQLLPVDTAPSYPRERKHEKPWMRHRRKGRNVACQEMEKDIKYKAEIAPWLESIKKNLDRDVYRTLQDHRIEDIDVNLIFQLLLHICKGAPGAILVFLPGISDITKLIKVMQDSHRFPESHYAIHPLHSKLPTLTQHKIFRKPSGDIRKIIIATNIAETSITIDDIVYVVDCAKIKYKGLNVQDHVSTLQTEWASIANLRQRRGRAGRCQAGVCYHLVTSYRASKLPERLLPELQRDDLLEPVLQIKRLRLGFAEQALAKMPAVPHKTTTRNAIRHLQQCGALDDSETLTPLGWHMARLPVHPAAGKLLLLGALFGCLERAASVAAVWGFKDPFNLVIGKEREIEEAKKNLALGEPSDHIAISEALIQWEMCHPYSEKLSFARDYFLSMSTLKLLSEMKKQFGQNLKQMGFLKSGDVKSLWENRNSDNLALFKAIVAASLYPNIATVSWKNMDDRRANALPSISVKTPEDSHILVHPSSVMFTRHDNYQRRPPLPLCANPGANWLVYWLKQRSTDLYVIDVTLVYTLPLLFFGELRLSRAENPKECLIDIKSIKVCCNIETAKLLFQLRSLLDQVLASKIMGSTETKRSSVFEEHVLNGVKRLITAEDASTEYLDDNDQSGSEDFNSGSYWR